ncbi:caffeine-induced death protein 2-domain-containing protein [Lipomyces oligophaga]|uniref:caffeine-induced death protein 2-domain-containing protein n=1 Tax=Lipomyces oligophaga TaxID=45792 RepID=UPI0034CD8F7B
MSSGEWPPAPSPELCYSAQTLRAFLNRSRALTDDVISVDLNGLPIGASTAERTSDQRGAARKRDCGEFVKSRVFSAWDSRDSIIEYCKDIASTSKAEQMNTVPTHEIPVDPRYDPYAQRTAAETSKDDQVLGWVANESLIEDIVRDRSWSIVCDKCADIEGATGINGNGWKAAYEVWRKNKKQ